MYPIILPHYAKKSRVHFIGCIPIASISIPLPIPNSKLLLLKLSFKQKRPFSKGYSSEAKKLKIENKKSSFHLNWPKRQGSELSFLIWLFSSLFVIEDIINLVGFFRQEGGEIHLEHLISFITALIARLVGDCVSKWLESRKKSDDYPTMKKTGAATPVFFVCVKYTTLNFLVAFIIAPILLYVNSYWIYIKWSSNRPFPFSLNYRVKENEPYYAGKNSLHFKMIQRIIFMIINYSVFITSLHMI